MIKLYMQDGCPFCRKVETAARQMGLIAGKDYIVIDSAPSTPGRETVVKVGGKSMVPFLVDAETSMYESDDIIAYLKKISGTHH